MIPNKSFYCQRYVAFYLTRYGTARIEDIMRSQTQYTWQEMHEAIRVMLRQGMLRADSDHKLRYTGTPMLAVAPEWVVRS